MVSHVTYTRIAVLPDLLPHTLLSQLLRNHVRLVQRLLVLDIRILCLLQAARSNALPCCRIGISGREHVPTSA